MSTQLVADPTTAGPAPSAEANQQTTLDVPMQEMIDSIRATIEIAARHGVARAQIQLQPEELGHISIRISQTNEGLRARVSADTQAGVQALNQDRSELRQSLSSLGLSLLQLDIGSSGQSQTHDGGDHSAERSEGSQRSTAVAAGEEDKALDEPSRVPHPSGAPLGEIVDVLA